MSDLVTDLKKKLTKLFKNKRYSEIESELDVEVALNEEAGADEEVDTGPADDDAQGDVVL